MDEDPGDTPVWVQPPADPQVENRPAAVTMPNGAIDLDGDASMVNGVVEMQNGPTSVPRHKQYFDIDLEKMHAKLYYEGYLTPKDFLEDVAKIVANTEVEPIDNERLFKAQQMFSAANVSLLSWEPQFAVECERMSQREAERRKEKERRRLEKGKGKVGELDLGRAATPETPYAPGTRRSARANGQEPEMAFTPDPERKLKRLRSQGGSGDSQESDEENDAGRSPKRARTLSDEEHDGTAQITPVVLQLTEEATSSINATIIEPLQPGRAVRFANALGMPEHDLKSLLNNYNPPEMPNDVINSQQFAAVPEVDGAEPTFPAIPLQPVLNREPSPLPAVVQPEIINVATAVHASDSLAVPKPSLAVHFADDLSGAGPSGSTQQSYAIEAMHANQQDIEMAEPVKLRTPSPSPPPPPPFHITAELVSELQSKLLDRTTDFNVEQLEQLRALCLSSVWNHRSDWDRDDLVRELLGVVDDFAGEVAMDWDAPSP